MRETGGGSCVVQTRSVSASVTFGFTLVQALKVPERRCKFILSVLDMSDV